MERYFFITLITGETFRLDFTKVIKGFVPLLPPATPQFLVMASELSREGFMKPGTDARPQWICASQIKTVEIVFEESKLKVNGNG